MTWYGSGKDGDEDDHPDVGDDIASGADLIALLQYILAEQHLLRARNDDVTTVAGADDFPRDRK